MHAGSIAEGERALRELREVGPALDAFGPVPYADFQCSIDDPPGYRNYWTAEQLPDLPDDVVDLIHARALEMPGSAAQIFCVAWGGAVARNDSGPLAGREARFVVHPLMLWDDPADDARVVAWGRGFRDARQPADERGAVACRRGTDLPERTSGLIVIGYDGSDEASSAIDAAATMLRATEAIVINVWRPSVIAATSPPLAPTTPPLTDEEDAALEAAAWRTAGGRGRTRRPCRPARARQDPMCGVVADIERTLAEVAHEHEADLVVVGRRGVSRVEAVVLGSVSNDTVRNSRRPVLVVPPRRLRVGPAQRPGPLVMRGGSPARGALPGGEAAVSTQCPANPFAPPCRADGRCDT